MTETSSPEVRDSLPPLPPPVQPPSAGFLLQLFVIPLLIVAIIVSVWMMFTWLAHLGSNPRDLVRDLRKLNDASWQKALTLADLLRNKEYDHLKADAEMAQELADTLDAQLDAQRFDDNSIKLRMFLCRALGEFRVEQALPVLVKAAETHRDLAEVDVRRTAIEALSVYAANNRSQSIGERQDVFQAVTSASRSRSDLPAEAAAHNTLRSTAAYALGVFGTPAALDRLALLLADGHSNTRYNAAVGLCRAGDARAEPVLLEMLDPDNPAAATGEEQPSGQDWMRLQVLRIGIQGAVELNANNPSADVAQIEAALQAIVDSDLPNFTSAARGLRVLAKDAILTLRQQRKS